MTIKSEMYLFFIPKYVFKIVMHLKKNPLKVQKGKK